MTQYAGSDAFASDFTIPDDTAPPTASNLLVSIEALADRTVWLKNRTGSHRLVASGRFVVADAGETFAVVSIGGNDAAWNSTSYTNDPTHLQLASIAGVLVNDIIELDVSGSIGKVSATHASLSKLIVNDGGVLDVAGARFAFGDTGDTHSIPAAIVGEHVATHNGTLVVGLDGRVTNVATTLAWFGAFSFRYRVWRVNP